MGQVRVFNPATFPSAYAPREAFVEKGEKKKMARHRHHRHHRHHRRHNPFGLSGGVFQDAFWNAGGALGTLSVANMVGQSGWADVAATGGVAFGLGILMKQVVKMGTAGEEVMKGGLTAAMIKAIHQLGFAKNLGLGLYAPSWFGVPTASSQYLRAYNANIGPAPRGQGTLYVSSGGALIPATVTTGPGGAPVAVPTGAPSGGGALGYHRFRSRYQGNY